MTKEELEKEAEEWIKDHSGLTGSYTFVKYDYDSMQKSYLAGAEPREKRIADLEATNKAISKECHKLVDSLEKKQNEIALKDEETKELKEQIEKMKSDVISERDHAHEAEDTITYTVLNDILEKWGIKEE